MKHTSWHRRRQPKAKSEPIDLVDEAAKLFDRSVVATLAESSGSAIIYRCVHPVEGVEGQPTCDLPVDGRALSAQVAALPEGATSAAYRFHCCVHYQKEAFEAAGVDTARIYDASPYFQELKSRAPV